MSRFALLTLVVTVVAGCRTNSVPPATNVGAATGTMANFLEDTFTGSAGTALSSHTGEDGATWTVTGNAVLSDSNALRNNNNSVTLGLSAALPGAADYTVDCHVVRKSVTGDYGGILLRAADNQNYYNVVWNDGADRWELYKAVANSFTLLGSYSQVLTVDQSYALQVVIASDNIRVLIDGVERINVNDSAHSAAGKVGVVFYSPVTATNSTGVHLLDIAGLDGTAAAFTVEFVDATDAEINLDGSTPDLTAPITYQWYRSTTSGFTPGAGNLLSGATTLTYTDSASLDADAIYYYRCVAVDSLENTATSNQIMGRLWEAPLVIGFIGDSITDGYPAFTKPGTIAGNTIQHQGPRRVTVVNKGVSGSRTSQWVAGSANLNAAIADFEAAGVTVVHIMLGTNDSAADVLAATYAANLQDAIDELFAEITGLEHVILSYPTGYDGSRGVAANYDEGGLGFLQTYCGAIDGLVNGTTVLQGATTTFSLFGGNHEDWLQADGVHLTTAGNQSLGEIWGDAINRALYAVGVVAAPAYSPFNPGRPGIR